MVGLKNLYRLVTESTASLLPSQTRVFRSDWLITLAQGLVVGSACEAGELMQYLIKNPDDWQGLQQLAEFYDYIEIQPIANNYFMIRKRHGGG